jgi:hypothetical protein
MANAFGSYLTMPFVSRSLDRITGNCFCRRAYPRALSWLARRNVISAFFAADKPRAREKDRATIESWVAAEAQPKWDALETAAASLRTSKHSLRPFHWPVEFSEVFALNNPGFDAIVGNPPFAGKNTISAANREHHYAANTQQAALPQQKQCTTRSKTRNSPHRLFERR